jgi:rfaE bifunctional protein nucleotidyltransferase chain/domain
MTPRSIESKILSFASLVAKGNEWRAQGKRVVTTNGCFDLLHWGHLKYLADARALGDLLVCGVNSDRSVRQLGKGDDRPLVAEQYRARQMAALEAIDYVVVFDEDTPLKFLEQVKPQIHVKGGDYLNKPLPEREIVEKNGGKIVCLPLEPGFSTTALVAKIRSSAP